MSELRATVILPTTGDRGPLLPYSVGSILRQTVDQLEIFILGDGVNAATRSVIRELMDGDPRIRFFDHPKDPRRGERHRHQALQEARGRIVCYLTDRDLMLPHHVETLDTLLRDADFGHTLRFGVGPEGGFTFRQTIDITHASDRERVREIKGLIPLSFAGHTLAMYRRLPHGWRTTPPHLSTDRYMWWQFLEHPACRTANSGVPTVLYFKRGDHPGWSTARRQAELASWFLRLGDPDDLAGFSRSVRDAAIADRARLARDLAAQKARKQESLADAEAGALKGETLRRLGALRHPRRTLRQAVGSRLAERKARKKARRRRARRSTRPFASDARTRQLTTDVELDVYWVNEEFGPGPAASLCVLEDEVMRLDLFGGRNSHLHLNLIQSRRVPDGGAARCAFPDASLEEHIRRAGFELANNAPYAFRTNQDARVRALEPDAESLARAARWMQEEMRDLCRLHAG